MLANTHRAICRDNRDLKKPKNEKTRNDIKLTIAEERRKKEECRSSFH